MSTPRHLESTVGNVIFGGSAWSATSTPSRDDHARREREMLRDAGDTLAMRERARSGDGSRRRAAAPPDPPAKTYRLFYYHILPL